MPTHSGFTHTIALALLVGACGSDGDATRVSTTANDDTSGGADAGALNQTDDASAASGGSGGGATGLGGSAGTPTAGGVGGAHGGETSTGGISSSGGASAGGSGGGAQVTEADLDRCSGPNQCIVVPYSHCCGSTKRAINVAHQDAYNAHPEWQVFDNPVTCAVIGACLSDANVLSARCADAPDGRCALVFP